jgi:hypothetical protein
MLQRISRVTIKEVGPRSSADLGEAATALGRRGTRGGGFSHPTAVDASKILAHDKVTKTPARWMQA